MATEAQRDARPDGGEFSRVERWAGFRAVGSILQAKTFAAQALVLGTTALITTEVVSRYFLGRPLGWSVEISEWALLAITMLGAALVLRNDGHVRVDLVIRVLPTRARRVVDVLAALIGFCVTALACYYTARTAYGEYVEGILTIHVLKFPRFWLLLFFPLGFLFLALEWLRKLLVSIEALITGREPEPRRVEADTGV